MEGRRRERGGDTVTDDRDSHGNPAATNQDVSEAIVSEASPELQVNML